MFSSGPYLYINPIRNKELLLAVKLHPFLHPYNIRTFLKELKENQYKRENIVKPISNDAVKSYTKIYRRLDGVQKKLAKLEIMHSLNITNLESLLIDPYGEYRLVIEMNDKILGSLRFEVTN